MGNPLFDPLGAAQQDCHVGEGCTVILKQLVPEAVLPLAVVDKGPAGEDDQAEKFCLMIEPLLPIAHDGHKMVERV